MVRLRVSVAYNQNISIRNYLFLKKLLNDLGEALQLRITMSVTWLLSLLLSQSHTWFIVLCFISLNSNLLSNEQFSRKILNL